MKRIAPALSLLLVLGIVLAAMAPLALAADVNPVTGDSGVDRTDSPITWTPSALNVTVGAGETVQASASFTSTVAIASAQLSVSFPLNLYVKVAPTGKFPVVAGTVYPVNLAVSLPASGINETPPAMAGTVQVVADGRMYNRPLVVTITRKIQPPPITWSPDKVQLQVSVPWTNSVADVTPPSTAQAVFSSDTAIANARLRASVPLNMVLDLSPLGPFNVAPGISYTVNMTAHVPVATAALAPLDGAGRRIISGQIEVYSADRVYARSLPVTVVLVPAPEPAVITWRPPSVLFTEGAGVSDSRVVTASSNLPAANATLKVTGAITPYLTVAPSPISFLPNAPVQVTLNVTAPTPFTKPLFGGLVVVDVSGRILSHDLEIVLAPQPQPEPAHINWKPSDAGFKLNPGQSDRRVVTATSNLTVENATLKVTGAITPYLTIPPSPLSFLPNAPLQVTLFVTAPVPFDRPIEGAVWVVDGNGKVLRDSLEVAITPALERPEISWRPPVVLFGMDAVQSAGRVVTVTSNVTVENATLKVTGSITPYLSILPGTLTLLPGAPLPVTLTVTSPLSPTINRPLAGEVVVVDSGGHALHNALKVMIMWYRPRASN